jgi:prolyl oligopeptidase
MSQLMTSPPYTPVEAVTEVLHGVAVTDPYRWLEDQESRRTREWLSAQQQYARSCLDRIPGRERIRERIRELLDVETCDSLQKAGSRYFFRKRSRGKQQPCIFFREGAKGSDQLLIDPQARGTGVYTAVKPVCASSQGRLLLYEVKEGGERTGRFEILDVNRREALPDSLPRGYLRGFVFAPDGTSFYYVHEPVAAEMRSRNAVYHHVLGTPFDEDRQIFSAGDRQNIRLVIVPGKDRLGFLVFQFLDETFTDFYLWPLRSGSPADSIIRSAHYRFSPRILDDGRILALTDREAPNARIVEVRPRSGREAEFVDVVATEGAMIQSWIVAGERILVSYIRDLKTEIAILDLSGRRLGQLPVEDSDTVRLVEASDHGEEVFLEQESFTKPLQILVGSPESSQVGLWAARTVPFASEDFDHKRIWFTAKDGTRVPMFLVGRRELFAGGCHPTIMTSYGGYGVPMTPQFSVFVAFLMEQGCLFALPNIRGGSEFGAAWHDSAKRRNRQVAFDDFLSAAEWLIESGHTKPEKLAIFGGSNSGLLVGAAMTQRPDLFRAVICMVPMLDMLRYHLFDHAHIWKSEFGAADHADDFAALYRYSPYHRIRNGTSYPATMFVSGDSDQNCNSLHARKMTARLQAANTSDFPIFLDYSPQRGHSPVLPLSTRIEALTDRMAFLCNQLGLTM